MAAPTQRRLTRFPWRCPLLVRSGDRAARGRDNLLPPILAAVRAHVTLGEICDTLRRVFGTHQPSVVF